jgi:hypothetical protein
MNQPNRNNGKKSDKRVIYGISLLAKNDKGSTNTRLINTSTRSNDRK